MGAAGIVYQTTFGPGSIFLNYYNKESKNIYITFNFGFILFNNRGIHKNLFRTYLGMLLFMELAALEVVLLTISLFHTILEFLAQKLMV